MDASRAISCNEGDIYIAGGVEMARTELAKSGSGATADRSSMVVFTDGEV